MLPLLQHHIVVLVFQGLFVIRRITIIAWKPSHEKVNKTKSFSERITRKAVWFGTCVQVSILICGCSRKKVSTQPIFNCGLKIRHRVSIIVLDRIPCLAHRIMNALSKFGLSLSSCVEIQPRILRCIKELNHCS